MDPDTAAAQLRSTQQQRELVADRAVSPPGYHVILGLLVGIFVASSYFRSVVANVAGMVIVLVGCLALFWYYRRARGVWVSGYHPGPARRVAVVGALAVAVLYVIGYVMASWSTVVPIVCGVIAAIVITVTGYKWDALYARDLRGAR